LLRQSKLTAARTEAASLKAQLAASRRNSRRKWRADLQPVAASLPVAPDPLVAINGIGPVFERRLKAAGILTLRDLASQTPERLREIIAPAKWQKIEPEAWIAEAAEFAKFVESQDTPGA
jgi:predicted flap endonuclease-1-like 5' DNA nuclease